MRKFIIVCTLAIIVSAGFASIPTKDINFNTVRAENDLAKLLRAKFAQHNVDIASVGGFSNRGTGKVFYVDSGAGGSSTSVGTTPASAAPTLDDGVNLCTANRGDVIFVMQDHAETIDNGTSDAIDLDVAGITVIGLGNGTDMPEFLYDTATDELVIDADNIVVMGLRFLAGVDVVTLAIDVKDGADDCAIIGCEFPEPTTSSWEFIRAIVITTADRLLIQGCLQYTVDAVGATNFIDNDGGVTNGCKYIGNVCIGEYAEGVIHSDDADLENFVAYNDLSNTTSGQHAIEFTAAATGTLLLNTVFTDAEATSIDPGSLKCFGNLVSIAIDTSGVIFPALADLATNLIGVDDADNAAATTSVASNRDGSILERLEFLIKYFETGTPGALVAPANTFSLLDILGSDGSTTTGAVAGSLLGAIGTDESAASTAFASTSVEADIDGSALERLEFVQSQYTVSKSITTLDNGVDGLFTVAGGPIQLIEIITFIDVTIGSEGNLFGYNVNPTTGSDLAFGTDGTALETNAAPAGAILLWSHVIAADLTKVDDGAALSTGTAGFIIPVGAIEASLANDGTVTGEYTVYMTYKPLSPGVTVVAQ